MSPSAAGGRRWIRFFIVVSIGIGIITSRMSRSRMSVGCFNVNVNINAVFRRSQQPSGQQSFVSFGVVDAFNLCHHHNGGRIETGSSSSSRSGSIHPIIHQNQHRHYCHYPRPYRQNDRGILLRQQPHSYCSSLITNLSTSSSAESSPSSTSRSSRSSSSSTGNTSRVEEKLLLKHLETIIGKSESELLAQCAWKNLQDPLTGYDQRFGRPAIRTYRAFVLPKEKEKKANKTRNRSDHLDDEDDNGDEKTDVTSIQLDAAAGRCARQIDFLIKRHRSHETEWIRHHDPASIDTIRSSESSTDEDTETARKKFPITLVLDNLRSAMNVGSIFRSAEATGCCRVVTCGITPHPGGSGCEKLAKAALGAERIVSTQHYPSTRSAIEEILEKRQCQNDQQQQNLLVVALETTDRSKLYTDLDYRLYYSNKNVGDEISSGQNPDSDSEWGEDAKGNENIDLADYQGIAIVLGNEVTGVDTNVLEMVDEIVELPTFGLKNSLNVASCAPVIIFEILRQWNANA
mmetsp:Transcript_31165/g.75324  ORF Transcript_31165/g.75324 Transcript_31165/m.75324 type:complete len:517 (+) Transcript_31165:57-1607(+)